MMKKIFILLLMIMTYFIGFIEGESLRAEEVIERPSRVSSNIFRFSHMGSSTTTFNAHNIYEGSNILHEDGLNNISTFLRDVIISDNYFAIAYRSSFQGREAITAFNRQNFTTSNFSTNNWLSHSNPKLVDSSTFDVHSNFIGIAWNTNGGRSFGSTQFVRRDSGIIEINSDSGSFSSFVSNPRSMSNAILINDEFLFIDLFGFFFTSRGLPLGNLPTASSSFSWAVPTGIATGIPDFNLHSFGVPTQDNLFKGGLRTNFYSDLLWATAINTQFNFTTILVFDEWETGQEVLSLKSAPFTVNYSPDVISLIGNDRFLIHENNSIKIYSLSGLFIEEFVINNIGNITQASYINGYIYILGSTGGIVKLNSDTYEVVELFPLTSSELNNNRKIIYYNSLEEANLLDVSFNSELGSISGLAENGFYFEGDEVSLRANPRLGYRFVSWSGDVFSTNRNLNITMPSADLNIQANFEPIPH